METKEENPHNYFGLIILLLVLIALFILSKSDSVKRAKLQYDLLISKLRKHERLKQKIEVRARATKRNLRIMAVSLFIVVEIIIFLFLFNDNRHFFESLEYLLSIDGIIVAIFILMFFAVFGITDVFIKVNNAFNLAVDKFVYNNYEEIRIEIEILKIEAKNKEDEIRELESIEELLKKK